MSPSEIAEWERKALEAGGTVGARASFPVEERLCPICRRPLGEISKANRTSGGFHDECGANLHPSDDIGRRIVRYVQTSFDPPAAWTISLQVYAGDNARGLKKRIGRSGSERKAVCHALAAHLRALCPFTEALASGKAVRVSLTRLGGRALDPHDNLPSSFKYVLDSLCLFLGIDDRNPALHVKYDQKPGGAVGIVVTLEEVR